MYILLKRNSLKSEFACPSGGVIQNRCTHNLLIQTSVILGVLSPAQVVRWIMCWTYEHNVMGLIPTFPKT